MAALHGGEDGRELQGDLEAFPESGRHTTDGRLVDEGPREQAAGDDARAVDLPPHLKASSHQRIPCDEGERGPAN